ncbi:MAG: hypothetical protein P1U36_08785 [Legionellaceae bacterium]|nr:hypothetical protein [Legionellaceae bacterium]
MPKDIVKEIKFGASGDKICYRIFEHKDRFYYNIGGSDLSYRVDQQFKFNKQFKLSKKEVSWIKGLPGAQDNPKLSSDLLYKIRQDETNKRQTFQKETAADYEAMTLRTAGATLKAAGKFIKPVRKTRASSLVQETPQGSFVPSQYFDPDDNNSDTNTESSTGSLEENPIGGLGTSVPRGQHGDESSDTLSTMTDSVQEFPSPPNDEFVLEPESDLDHDPALSSEDSHKEVIEMLRAMNGLLAGLKGNEPQLKQVREALQLAMKQAGITDIQVDMPEPTVVAPDAGLDTVVPITGSEPQVGIELEVDKLSPTQKIEENIRILKAVQGKINTLLSEHQEKLSRPLSDVLNDLSSAVHDSIYQAENTLTTPQYKEQLENGRPMTSNMITTPLTPSGPVVSNPGIEEESGQNNDDDDSSTYNPSAY